MLREDCYKTPFKETFNPDIPADLFGGYRTTNQADYKKYCDAVRTRINYEQRRTEDPEKVGIRPFKRVDHETLAPFHADTKVPVGLDSPPKPIVQTNPHIPFKELGKLKESNKEEVIKTRPRLVFTPSIPIDDVTIPTDREIICKHMYTTQSRKVEKEATEYFKPVKPRIDKIETQDKVSLRIDKWPPLPRKFREQARRWDDYLIRGDPDPTRDFWIRKGPTVICGACVDPYRNIVPENVKKELEVLVKEERLSATHDVKPGLVYTGFRPMLPKGIPIARKQLSTLHPLLSTKQLITNRTREEVAELEKIREDEFIKDLRRRTKCDNPTAEF